jgi:hypothetical protein
MGIPSDIADAAQPGMKIMTLWTAAIGARRFYQGVMIRHGRTRSVGYGTAVRLLSSGGTGILLALLTHLPGVYVGSIALMAGVSTEALFVAWVVRSTVRRILSREPERGAEVLTMWDILRYHSPLAATSLLSLLAQPLIGAGLARMPHPEENLAAWPVVWGILFMFRSPAFALPETVIALIGERHLKRAVRTFSLRIGVACSAAMVLVVSTPLLELYISHVAGLPANLSRYVFPAILLGLALPFINSIHSWLRGLLLAARSTNTIYWGMGLNLAVTAAMVAGGVLLYAPGAETAVIALTTAFIVEVLYLRKAGRHALPA